LTALLFPVLAAAGPYAIVVGAEVPPPGRATLRYAASDARAVRDVLVEVGGHAEDEVLLLVDPTPDELLAALASVPPELDRFLLYYSGHADDGALYPHGRRLPVGQLKASLDAVQASVRIGVVDSCRGGGWTGAKGVSPAEPFEITLGGEGTAYLAASSGAEDAHELEVLGGSIFTHHWTAGLRGAADADGDGLVTLGESFDWAQGHTVRDSALLAGQPQHPSFHLDVHGRGDLVLADLRGSRSAVTLRWGAGEIELFALDTGVHVADLEVQPAVLVLAPGRYAARRLTERGVEAAEFVVEAGVQGNVSPEDFVALGSAGLVAHKGDELAPIHRTTPYAGRFMNQLAFGSWVGPEGDGQLSRHLLFRGALQVGLTDRLSVSFPVPGLSLSLGKPQGLEVLLFGGFYEGGLGMLSPDGGRSQFGLYGYLGGGFDQRRLFSERVSLLTSSWAGAPTTLVPRGQDTGHVTFGTGFGLELHLAPRLTLRPSVGGEMLFEDDGRIVYTLGSSLRRGVRELPLLQVDLGDTVALEADFGLAFDPDRPGAPVQETWIGLSTSGMRKDRKRTP
jgi:hypothetical protein